MNDVRIELVLPFGHDGQVHGEIAGLRLVRMQVPECLHVRHAHNEKVHEMAVVRDQVIQADAVRLLAAKARGLGLIGIIKMQAQQAACPVSEGCMLGTL